MAGVRLDKVLEALEAAEAIWEKTTLAGKEEKLLYARQLWHFEHFSLPQIAKIVRLNSRYVYEELQPNNTKGGRFDPATLSTLTRIRRAHLQGQKVPHQLISMGIKGGTSYTCLTSLTKIPYSAYYEIARAAGSSVPAKPSLTQAEWEERGRLIAEKRAALEEQRVAMEETRVQEIRDLRAQNWTIQDIATAFGVRKHYVIAVSRGE